MNHNKFGISPLISRYFLPVALSVLLSACGGGSSSSEPPVVVMPEDSTDNPTSPPITIPPEEEDDCSEFAGSTDALVIESEEEWNKVRSCSSLSRELDLSQLNVAKINLGKLETLAGLRVVDNDIVTEITAPNLKEVSGSIIINKSDELISAIFSALTKVVGDISGGSDNRRVTTNKKLEQFEAPLLDIIEGSFSIDRLRLTSLQLGNLKSVGGNVSLWNSFAAETGQSFDQLETIGGGLLILAFGTGQQTNEFPQLKKIGNFQILINNFSSLSRLIMPALEEVDGYFSVEGSGEGNRQLVLNIPALTTIRDNLTLSKVTVSSPQGEDFPALTHIGGDVSLVSVGSLKLSQLKEIDGILWIGNEVTGGECQESFEEDMPVLMNMAVESVQSLSICGTEELTNVNLPNLSVIERSFFAFNNGSLVNIDVEDLTEVGAQFVSRSNPVLTNISFLANRLNVGETIPNPDSNQLILDSQTLNCDTVNKLIDSVADNTKINVNSQCLP